MAQIISTFQEEPSHRQSVTLGEIQYGLRLTWRDRTGSWYADLWTADGTPVWLGQRLSPGWSIGMGLTPEGKPDGMPYVRGPSSGYLQDDLGKNLEVVFWPTDELPAATITAQQPLTVTVP